MTDENLLKTHCLDALEAQLKRNLLDTEREPLDMICNLLPLYYHSRTGEPLYPKISWGFAFNLTWALPSIACNTFSIELSDQTLTYTIKTPSETKEIWKRFYSDPDEAKEMERVFLSGLYKAYTDFFLDPDYESKPQRNHYK
jgi:hypothetical protein